jgi:hypothetical protein
LLEHGPRRHGRQPRPTPAENVSLNRPLALKRLLLLEPLLYLDAQLFRVIALPRCTTAPPVAQVVCAVNSSARIVAVAQASESIASLTATNAGA